MMLLLTERSPLTAPKLQFVVPPRVMAPVPKALLLPMPTTTAAMLALTAPPAALPFKIVPPV